jgi:NTP pyrophosphatase (non-canonical NTP hydrolase)
MSTSKDDWYYALGLTGEAGEYADKIKKSYRLEGYRTPLDPKAAALELGDVLWYLTMSAAILGFTLEQIAEMNVEKLIARRNKGTLGGEGDNR